ncbi:gamma carbonic anhydrase family protein [Rhizorhabdus argentea]|uniref:gamma carbonic anhydrase family protein n=1 Tax=Rhizorhabdus argentea TaxID=1387174 RepID=UPI0030EBAD3A
MSDATTILSFGGIAPTIDPTAFVAPGARVIGDVHLGAGASLWYNVVVRGDVNHVRIGARTNIQDGSVVHVSTKTHPTLIGEDVLIGHMAIVHGCILHDRAFVGLGAVVMDGCVIEPDGMLAAGAMLTPGKRIPSGQLWSGRPARFMRELSPQEMAQNQKGVAAYVETAKAHRAAIVEQG